MTLIIRRISTLRQFYHNNFGRECQPIMNRKNSYIEKKKNKSKEKKRNHETSKVRKEVSIRMSTVASKCAFHRIEPTHLTVEKARTENRLTNIQPQANKRYSFDLNCRLLQIDTHQPVEFQSAAPPAENPYYAQEDLIKSAPIRSTRTKQRSQVS